MSRPEESGTAAAADCYPKLQRLARQIARKQRPPLFYADHAPTLRYSCRVFHLHPSVRAVRAVVSGGGEAAGHGFRHARAVALEGGAVVAIECSGRDIPCSEVEELMALAQVAGLLHDCHRDEAHHDLLGAAEARRILALLSFSKREIACVATAIANHLAFQEPQCLRDSTMGLVSDALYDADKFRWGPENFTQTLWAMLAARKIPPERLHSSYRQQLDKIAEIKNTFRSETGKTYGPDFIDLGLAIGREVFKALEEMVHLS